MKEEGSWSPSPPQVRFHPEASYTCDELQPVANIPGLAPERKFSCHFHLQQTAASLCFPLKHKGRQKKSQFTFIWRASFLPRLNRQCLFVFITRTLCVHCASNFENSFNPVAWPTEKNDTILVLPTKQTIDGLDPCHWRETSFVFDQLKEKERISVKSKWDGAAAGRHCLPISRDHELVQTRFDLCYFSRLFLVGSFPRRLRQYWFMGLRRCQACD